MINLIRVMSYDNNFHLILFRNAETIILFNLETEKTDSFAILDKLKPIELDNKNFIGKKILELETFDFYTVQNINNNGIYICRIVPGQIDFVKLISPEQALLKYEIVNNGIIEFFGERR